MVTLTLLTFLVGALADYVIRQRKRKYGAVTNETALTTAAAGPSPVRICAGLCRRLRGAGGTSLPLRTHLGAA